jgi:hypothetical protein
MSEKGGMKLPSKFLIDSNTRDFIINNYVNSFKKSI